MRRLNRADTVLSAMLCMTAVLLWLLMRTPSVDPVLPLVIERNAVPIDHLDQTRAAIQRTTVWVDRLDLARGGQLRHAVLGRIGPAEQFFIDLKLRLRAPEARVIHFDVESDDGFALELNERRVCAFTAHRGLSGQRCRVMLEAGEHALHLSYFQAGGPAGLRVRHAASENGPWVFLGEDNPWLQVIGATP